MGKNLTLTGMMGVGKSTIGKKLAKRLKCNFVDVDNLIERKEGMSINLIFKNKSESYFRKIESEITMSELKKVNSVISLGGGAFLNNKISYSELHKKLLSIINLRRFKAYKKKKPLNISQINTLNNSVRLKIRELCI